MKPSEDKPDFEKEAQEYWDLNMSDDHSDMEEIPVIDAYRHGSEDIWTDYVEPLRLKLKELEAWKRQHIEVTAPLFEWGQKQRDIQLGESIIKHIIKKLESSEVTTKKE